MRKLIAKLGEYLTKKFSLLGLYDPKTHRPFAVSITEQEVLVWLIRRHGDFSDAILPDQLDPDSRKRFCLAMRELRSNEEFSRLIAYLTGLKKDYILVDAREEEFLEKRANLKGVLEVKYFAELFASEVDPVAPESFDPHKLLD